MANIGYGQEYTGVQSPFTVQVDKSLTKTGWAADAASAGLSVSEMVDKVNTFDGRIETAETNASEAKEAAQAAQTAVASKQDLLVNQENIKSINGNSILGSGNLSVRTYQVFNSGWNVSGTTTEFCESIRDDEDATAGMAYLGVLHCNDLPGLVQGECVVEIIADDNANGKNIHLILTSAEIYPYKWELHYVKINGLYTSTGWLGYQTEITPNPTLAGTEDALTGLQVGDTKYKIEKAYIHNITIYQNDATDGVLRVYLSLITSDNSELNTYNKVKSVLTPMAGSSSGNINCTGYLERTPLFSIYGCTVYNDEIRLYGFNIDGSISYPYTNLSNATYSDVVCSIW